MILSEVTDHHCHFVVVAAAVVVVVDHAMVVAVAAMTRWTMEVKCVMRRAKAGPQLVVDCG